MRATNVRLADEALVPTTPIRPDKPVDIAVGLLVGLILGVTLAFIRESLDRTIKTAEDIERSDSGSHFGRDSAGDNIARAVWPVLRSRGPESSGKWKPGIGHSQRARVGNGGIFPGLANFDSALQRAAAAASAAGYECASQ